MSSKTKKDNFEQPIFVETTILKINIKSTGDLITKEGKYIKVLLLKSFKSAIFG